MRVEHAAGVVDEEFFLIAAAEHHIVLIRAAELVGVVQAGTVRGRCRALQVRRWIARVIGVALLGCLLVPGRQIERRNAAGLRIHNQNIRRRNAIHPGDEATEGGLVRVAWSPVGGGALRLGRPVELGPGRVARPVALRQEIAESLPEGRIGQRAAHELRGTTISQAHRHRQVSVIHVGDIKVDERGSVGIVGVGEGASAGWILGNDGVFQQLTRRVMAVIRAGRTDPAARTRQRTRPARIPLGTLVFIKELLERRELGVQHIDAYSIVKTAPLARLVLGYGHTDRAARRDACPLLVLIDDDAQQAARCTVHARVARILWSLNDRINRTVQRVVNADIALKRVSLRRHCGKRKAEQTTEEKKGYWPCHHRGSRFFRGMDMLYSLQREAAPIEKFNRASWA